MVRDPDLSDDRLLVDDVDGGGSGDGLGIDGVLRGIDAGAGGGGGGTLRASCLWRSAPHPASTAMKQASAMTWSDFDPCTRPAFAAVRRQRGELCWNCCGSQEPLRCSDN